MDANELYDPEFRKLIKSKKPTIIIPVGSLEQHGAHLPITTDSDIVTEVASRLAKKCGFISFPTISYGVSYEHAPLFHVSIRLIPIIRTIISSLVMYKIKSVIILNGHHGNVDTLERMEDGYQQPNPEPELELDFKDVKIDFYSYWHFMEHEFDHAGFVETSIMLAISDKVKMEKAEKGLITKGLSKEEIQRIKKLSTETGGFPKVAKNGVWGDPTGATKKDGKKFLAEIVRNLAKECQT
uniref:Creatininase n=3 Tax=environmental samples TaxID=651140 RepID=A0A075GUY8_9ARCH|nr:creatininase [uncultured marine thaumarchaeote KM3_204_F10]AIF10764.1 creatininase [uncultured marine thaumarchaeote KM3_47_A03]AIF10812.1 creatininase [uncultured marine thaumarchaeote KM3_47_A04]